MSSLLLERLRATHELVEMDEQAICEVLDTRCSGQKAKVHQQHQISQLLDEIVAKKGELKRLYEDSDGLLKEELATIGGANIFNSFYETLNATRDYHQRFPGLAAGSGSGSSSSSSGSGGGGRRAEVDVPFSGAEIFGKYLDLHHFYVSYCNLPDIPTRDQDYIEYLDKFFSFFHIAENIKGTKAYRTYVADLWQYLIDFLARVQPLIDLKDTIGQEWRGAFEEAWTNSRCPGWKSKGSTQEAQQPLRLGMYNTQQELEALGTDRLKEALEAMGLKCGGTLQNRASRLWSVRGVKPADVPQKLRAKKVDAKDGQLDPRKETAWTEHKISALCDFMMDIVSATRKHAEKQQTRTMAEREAEMQEEEFGLLPDMDTQEGEEEDEGPIYNPLNIPLGWDGKPIPYWLYKLHGLGVEFNCEICGNTVYRGRLPFDRHFQQGRHAHGMRMLGIPNTKHFHDITKIDDAIALHEKMRGALDVDQFKGEVHEQYEDSHGNVLNRRTFEDFTRQGLL